MHVYVCVRKEGGNQPIWIVSGNPATSSENCSGHKAQRVLISKFDLGLNSNHARVSQQPSICQKGALLIVWKSKKGKSIPISRGLWMVA